jgi:methylated-DNA-[protein]-cysteine S-methyltransferase
LEGKTKANNVIPSLTGNPNVYADAYWPFKFENKTGALIFREQSVYELILPEFDGEELTEYLYDKFSGISKEPRQPGLIQELENYFSGKKPDFSGAVISFADYTDFQVSVLREFKKLAWGKVLTYGELARMSGKQGAARAVGGVLSCNRTPILIPCHRVLAKNGIGGFSKGVEWKKKLLKIEGTCHK